MKKRNSSDRSHERKRLVMAFETNLIAVPRRSECRSYSSLRRHSTIRHLLSVRAISLLSAWWAVWLTMIIVLVVTLVYVRNQKRVARHCTSHRWRWFAHVHIEEKEDCRHRNTLLMVHFFSFLVLLLLSSRISSFIFTVFYCCGRASCRKQIFVVRRRNQRWKNVKIGM